MDGQYRKNIKPGDLVGIVTKGNQLKNIITEGVVKDILTNSQHHPHGIKVRLITGEIGRVKVIKES